MTDRIMIVVGGGRSLRFGDDKLMTSVAGLPLIAHTVAAVVDHVDICVLVCREDQIPTLTELGLGVVLVPGGPSRTASEMAGLSAVGGPAGLIGIHDGARPLVRASLIETLFQTAAEVGGAVPVTEPAFPLVHRSDLSLVDGAAFAQTPQVFHGDALIAAYVKAARIEYEAQDTAEIVQRFSKLEVKGVPGDQTNIKVTHPADIELVRSLLETSRSEPQ
ncbi:MAG: 2-C-methyl-D-erythritol 4-phosphate cytidylyltransferase [Actinomycetota bacterium]|nr:2-C-methyl-D-erythritol 4-phosphate cytidylyltransferase [Actinomycetota bacterium]